MSILQDLNKAYVILQEIAGKDYRPVPLNDLDCCLIQINEIKIARFKKAKAEQLAHPDQ